MMRPTLLLLCLLAAPLGAQTPAPPDSVAAVQLGPKAIRFLRLQYAAYGNREYAACLIGAIRGDTVQVVLVAPADVSVSDSVSVQVASRCHANWPSVVGVAHNHPGGLACSHNLNGTRVHTSDWYAFQRELVAVSLIVCGDTVAVVDRSGREVLAPLPEPSP